MHAFMPARQGEEFGAPPPLPSPGPGQLPDLDLLTRQLQLILDIMVDRGYALKVGHWLEVQRG